MPGKGNKQTNLQRDRQWSLVSLWSVLCCWVSWYQVGQCYLCLFWVGSLWARTEFLCASVEALTRSRGGWTETGSVLMLICFEHIICHQIAATVCTFFCILHLITKAFSAVMFKIAVRTHFLTSPPILPTNSRYSTPRYLLSREEKLLIFKTWYLYLVTINFLIRLSKTQKWVGIIESGWDIICYLPRF